VEQIAFGVDRARSGEDFEEAIEVVCGRSISNRSRRDSPSRAVW
jgi:hypothetical protein